MRCKAFPSCLNLCLATFGLMAVPVPCASGVPTEAVLYTFKLGADGGAPAAGLIRDAAGNLYGTTFATSTGGNGTVFELSPAVGGGWTHSVLYSFGPSPDGASPWASLVFDAVGNLYGTTTSGGTHGVGVVFELSRASGGNWAETVLHNFSNKDGNAPHAGLIFDSQGILYGTTLGGGTYGKGVVFKLTPSSSGAWTEAVLHSFGSASDGSAPSGGLLLGPSGVLYGATEVGGTYKKGTVFKLKPSASGSWTETILYNFGVRGLQDGIYPTAGLTLDSGGTLYGTTLYGGLSSHGGTVFKLMHSSGGGWTLKVLHTFKGPRDGSDPHGVIFDQGGKLYGTTVGDGTATGGHGSVFKLTPSASGWTESTLYTFTGGDDGASPYGERLIFDGAGSLYDTAYGGGTYGVGLVFEITR